MKKETPRSLKREAGLTSGCKTVASDAGMPTTGRDQRQKRSPKERSAVSGTLIHVSQVALDHPGRDHVTRWAKGDGSAPASRIAGGIGTARLRFGGLGLSSFAFGSGSLQPAELLSTTTDLKILRKAKPENENEFCDPR